MTIDKDLIAALPGTRTPWNKRICEGFATEEMGGLDEFLHRCMRCAFNNLHEGLTYEGYCVADPREQLAEMTRTRGSKSLLEQSRSSMVMMRYNFYYKGERLKPRYMYVPYVETGAMMLLRNTKYIISPTLSDNLFGVSDNSIFTPIGRSRVTFRRNPYYFIADDKTVSADTYWSRLHHTGKDNRNIKLFPQLMNYIFAEMGAIEGFKYMGYEAVFGNMDTLNDTDFPTEDWVICRSSGIRPVKKRVGAETEPILVAVKRDSYDRITETVLASLFYMLDNCTDLSYVNPATLHDPRIWRRILTRFIWKNPNPVEQANEVDTHIETLNQYLDELFLEKLMLEGINVHSFTMLLRHMVQNFSIMTINSDPASTHDKHLTVVPNVAFGAVKMIFTLMFELARITGKKLTKQSLESTMGYKFNQFVFMELASMHQECTVAESATDLMPFKLTGLMVRPSKSAAGSVSSERDNPAFHLHPEFFTTHSVLVITKSSPAAHGRINPNLKVGANNRILPDPELQGIRDEFARLK